MGQVCSHSQEDAKITKVKKGKAGAKTRDVGFGGDDSDLDKNQFVSASETCPDYVLFGDTSPNDLQQGTLGDCWLLSAMSAMAEFPDALQDLIVDNEDGTFTVTLFSFEDGDFTEVEVNDAMPTLYVGDKLNQQMAYCHQSKQDEIWPCVLEKAIAKMAGGYAELNQGVSTWAFGMLTGAEDLECINIQDGVAKVGTYAEAPPSNRPHDWKGMFYEGEAMDSDELMELLVEYDGENYLMCAGTHAGSDTHISDQGIVQGHAYTIISVFENPGDSGANLLYMRNPWGKQEWQGAWSDGAAEWDENPDVADEVGYEEGDDGAFFIELEDFLQNYGCIFVCKKCMAD